MSCNESVQSSVALLEHIFLWEMGLARRPNLASSVSITENNMVHIGIFAGILFLTVACPILTIGLLILL